MDAQAVKAKARELGADLVGVTDTARLNLHPPDPRWPQTPERIWSECQSIIVIARRIPAGFFRSQDLSTKLYTAQLVMNSLDRIALELSYFIEESGFLAFPAAQNYTDPKLKKATYGPLSLRHLAVEAGIGTLGLNLNLLTPDFGPRVYLRAILTDISLESDRMLNKQLCRGPKCGRCLLACPADAIGHWELDKRRCSTQAQRYGAASLIRHIHRIMDAKTVEEAKELVRSTEFVSYWQALRTGAGAYGGCYRCMEVCPVGNDYSRYLRDVHARIPEITDEKIEKLRKMISAENNGLEIAGFNRSFRWILGKDI